MKLSPIVIPHLVSPSSKLWGDTVVATYLIYRNRLAISSAVAFTHILWEVLRMNKPPKQEWWLEEYMRIVRELEGDNSRYSPRSGEIRYTGPTWYFIEKIITKVLNENWTLYKLYTVIGSGG